MKITPEIAKFHLRSVLIIYGLLFIGLSIVLAGCGNFVAGGDIDVGVKAFREYMPNVTHEVSLGEAALVKNLTVTVTGVRATDGRDGNMGRQLPPEGHLFVLVNVLLENQGAKHEDVATRMSFGLFDSMGKPQEWAYYLAAAGSIDGRIDPGRERMGELTWKVAENAEGLTLIFGDVAFSLGEASGYWPGSPG